MRTRFLLAVGVALGGTAMPAHAETLKLTADFDDFTDSPDGESLSRTNQLTSRANASLKGWDLSLTMSYKRTEGTIQSSREARRAAVIDGKPEKAHRLARGLTDLKFRAARSVALNKNLALDMVGRVTLPTGNKRAYLGRGRVEMVADAGLRYELHKTSIWAGGARRFRTTGYESTGRDVNEFYAGMRRELGKRTSWRADYVITQAEYPGRAKEQTLSTELTRSLKSGATLSVSGLAYTDMWGKGVQGNIALRWPIASIL